MFKSCKNGANEGLQLSCLCLKAFYYLQLCACIQKHSVCASESYQGTF